MLTHQTSKRMRERIASPLQIRVDCQESATYRWIQATRLIDVTQHGAGFTLTRPTETGRLLKLIMPMPSQLRTFDYTEEQYFVWGIVRHCSIIPESRCQGFERFRVGVAFVGKSSPPGFQDDPATRFEPSPPNGDQAPLWRIARARPSNGCQGEKRRETRLSLPIEVVIEALGENGEPGLREDTVTENISRLGASVLTSLAVDVGRFVRISSERDRVSMYAVVRCRITNANGIARLGLEFVDNRWPLEGA